MDWIVESHGSWKAKKNGVDYLIEVHEDGLFYVDANCMPFESFRTLSMAQSYCEEHARAEQERKNHP